MTTDIDTLAESVLLTAKLNGWYDKEPTFPEIAVMCHAEISEAVEAFRVSDFEQCEREMVDLVMRAISHLKRQGVNIGAAIIEKNRVNMGRGYKHGGKTI